MYNSYLSKNPQVKFFINKKGLIILSIINDNTNCFTKDLLFKLQDFKVSISKNQIYRYIDSFEKYNLVIVHSWSISLDGKGYRYEITRNGIKMLEFLLEVFRD